MSSTSGILKDWDGDGCIAMIESDETFEHLMSKNIPLIDLGLRDHQIPIPRMITDNEKIGKMAAEHLREFGHKEIFVIGHGNNIMFKERLKSLQKYSKINDCKVTILRSASEIKNVILNELEDILERRGQNLESSLSFFGYNDSIVADLLLCLRNDIRVPENIAILGVDNDDLIISSLVLGPSSVDSDQEGLWQTS